MPGSSKFGKLYTTLILKKLYDFGALKRVMDVGVGGGTYHDLLSPHMPDLAWVGVEVWSPYIERFSLKDRYPELYNEDIRKLDLAQLGDLDLTLFGDILEHMTKEEAQEVIGGILDRSRLVLISIPIVHYPQDEIEGNPYEVHVKDDWSHEEVCSSFPNVISAYLDDHIGVYCLSKDAQIVDFVQQIHPIAAQLSQQADKERDAGA